MELPLREWVHFEITSGLGPDRGKAWSLSVRGKSGLGQDWPALPFGSSDWDRLNWLGFVSQADRATTFQLDNLRIDPTVAP